MFGNIFCWLLKVLGVLKTFSLSPEDFGTDQKNTKQLLKKIDPFVKVFLLPENLKVFGEQKIAPEYLERVNAPDRKEQLFLKLAPSAASAVILYCLLTSKLINS